MTTLCLYFCKSGMLVEHGTYVSQTGATFKIQEAAKQMQSGTRLLVMNGNYTSQRSAFVFWIFNKHNIQLANYPDHHPIIRFDGSGGLYMREVSKVEIRGFEIVGPNNCEIINGNLKYYGITIESSNHIRIHNNNVHYCQNVGIYINKGDYCIIEDNDVSSIVLKNAQQIDDLDKTKMFIVHNRVFERNGLIVENTDRVRIVGNVLWYKTNKYKTDFLGLKLYAAQDIEVRDNFVTTTSKDDVAYAMDSGTVLNEGASGNNRVCGYGKVDSGYKSTVTTAKWAECQSSAKMNGYLCHPILKVSSPCGTGIPESSKEANEITVIMENVTHSNFHPCHLWQLEILKKPRDNFWSLLFWEKFCCCNADKTSHQSSSLLTGSPEPSSSADTTRSTSTSTSSSTSTTSWPYDDLGTWHMSSLCKWQMVNKRLSCLSKHVNKQLDIGHAP